MQSIDDKHKSWVAETEVFLASKKKVKNQSVEFENVRQAKALIVTFEDGDQPQDTPETLQLLIQLCNLSRDKKRAEKYSKRRFVLLEKSYLFASEAMARAKYLNGDLAGAQAYLDKVPFAKLSRSSKVRHGNIASALQLSNASKTAVRLLDAGPEVTLTEADTAALLGHLDPALQPDLRVMLNALGIHCAGVSVTEAASPAPVGLIFCGGFKWSGASALRDYLCDFETVFSPPPKLRFFTEPRYCLQTLSEEMQLTDPDLLQQARGFAMEKILGISLGRRSPPKQALKIWQSSMAAHDWGTHGPALLRDAARFFGALLAGGSASAFPRAALERFMCTATSATTPEGCKVSVFDSVVRAPDRALLSLLENGRLFAVFRDPRDMYVTHVVRGGWSKGVEVYIEELSEMLNAFDTADGEVVRVQYERFVLSQDYREDIGRQALGPQAVVRERLNFRAADSMANIGIHTSFEDQAALKRLAETFPHLCVDPAKL